MAELKHKIYEMILHDDDIIITDIVPLVILFNF